MGDYLIVSNTRNLSYIDVGKIVFIKLYDGYRTLIYMEKGMRENNEPYMINMSLDNLSRHLNEQLGEESESRRCLIRVGGKLMINTNYLTEIDLTNRQLVLDQRYVDKNEIRQNAARDALVDLKDHLEGTLKNSKHKKK